MGRRKKPINRTNIPQYQVEAIARCLLPDILAFYESEEGQREFAQWKKEQEEKKKEKEYRSVLRSALPRQTGQTSHLSDSQGKFPVPISGAAV